MRKIVLLILAVGLANLTHAQDLPSNPEPGKCYVRCTTPDVYVNEDVQVMVKPAYKVLKTVPAQYETVTERVMVKAAGKKLVVVPEKWGTETISYVKKQGASTLRVIPASFSSDSETLEIKPAYAQWELGTAAPDCASANPDDCRYWCYKGYPAEFQTVAVQRLANDASTTSTPVSEVPASYTKRVVVEPARVEEVEIPAEYATITKTVLVKDAQVVEETIPAVYKTITREVLQTKGGLTTWKEVECELLEYNDLNINWNLGSATLTAEAKREIDTKLLPVLKDGVRVEIASHTDSRGTAASNRDLSERRAQAVTNYLISKGINSSRIVSNGYGESQLLNRCADGVSCSEREHRANRRTQFRIIQ
ncbi:OmpA family protein [Gilvibacter sediminis]|uniref:OmpA family protein n=1 Tax=Gilvibacter sediminis TaxID=379071 RepID=UPI00234FBBE3|nr:OmpA family protein [Gilvibacter sediminis]MDC7998206.1 OmpA family protein [Gilvibacter sediminis]